MTRTRVVLVLAFLVTFAAGGAAGLLVSWPAVPAPQRHGLAAELDLTSEQEEKMKAIWSDVMKGGDRARGTEQRREASRRRDEAVAALLTAAQKPAYEKILQDYQQQREEYERQRREVIEAAIARTKAILTPAQAAKYDELREKRGSWRGSGPRYSPHGRRGGPTTRPEPPKKPE